jgi:hypothetical protein
MRELNAARDLLLDPARRAELDSRAARFRAQAAPPPSSHASRFFDLARERRRARRLRQALLLVSVLALLGVMLALSILAPQALVIVFRLAAAWVTLLGPVFLALGLALLLGYLVTSLRGW